MWNKHALCQVSLFIFVTAYLIHLYVFSFHHTSRDSSHACSLLTVLCGARLLSATPNSWRRTVEKVWNKHSKWRYFIFKLVILLMKLQAQSVWKHAQLTFIRLYLHWTSIIVTNLHYKPLFLPTFLFPHEDVTDEVLTEEKINKLQDVKYGSVENLDLTPLF